MKKKNNSKQLKNNSFPKISLSDNLAFIAIVVTVIGIVVSAYFGYLAVKPSQLSEKTNETQPIQALNLTEISFQNNNEEVQPPNNTEYTIATPNTTSTSPAPTQSFTFVEQTNVEVVYFNNSSQDLLVRINDSGSMQVIFEIIVPSGTTQIITLEPGDYRFELEGLDIVLPTPSISQFATPFLLRDGQFCFVITQNFEIEPSKMSNCPNQQP